MIKVIFEKGGGLPNIQSSAYITIYTPFYRIRSCMLTVRLSGATVAGGFPALNYFITEYDNAIVLKTGANISSGTSYGFMIFYIEGDFNFDNFIIESDGYSDRRIEVRNENDVLITDNGIPWSDGTYPPDAKNRAGLAGLHAAPAVINTELETALMGDATNKERVEE